MRHPRRVIGGIVILTCATLTAQSPPTRSSASGVYTADQAAAREQIYLAGCASCHGDQEADLDTAELASTPPLLSSAM